MSVRSFVGLALVISASSCGVHRFAEVIAEPADGWSTRGSYMVFSTSSGTLEFGISPARSGQGAVAVPEGQFAIALYLLDNQLGQSATLGADRAQIAINGIPLATSLASCGPGDITISGYLVTIPPRERQAQRPCIAFLAKGDLPPYDSLAFAGAELTVGEIKTSLPLVRFKEVERPYTFIGGW